MYLSMVADVVPDVLQSGDAAVHDALEGAVVRQVERHHLSTGGEGVDIFRAGALI